MANVPSVKSVFRIFREEESAVQPGSLRLQVGPDQRLE